MQRHLEPGYPWRGDWGWRIGVSLGRVVLPRWFPASFTGSELVPEGPIVVAANHYSHLDPVIAGMVAQRPIRYLAVDELYGNSWFFDGLTTWLGAIPMSRTKVPLGALRLALQELAAGGTVGVFPEGVRVWRWGEVAPKRGAAWLALRAGVPMVPIAIAGTEEAMGRGTARISRRHIQARAGAPIHPADVADESDPVAAATDLWRERVGSMLAEMYGS